MYHAPYVSICECAASKKVRLLSESSSEIGLSVSQVVLSIVSEVTGVSGVNGVGEDKSITFKAYLAPLQIHSCWYELPVCTCRSGDLSLAPSC